MEPWGRGRDHVCFICRVCPGDRVCAVRFLGFCLQLRKLPAAVTPWTAERARALTLTSFALTQVDEELAVAAIQQVDDGRWNIWTSDIALWSVSAVMHSRTSRNEARASGNESNRQCHQKEESERVCISKVYCTCKKRVARPCQYPRDRYNRCPWEHSRVCHRVLVAMLSARHGPVTSLICS